MYFSIPSLIRTLPWRVTTIWGSGSLWWTDWAHFSSTLCLVHSNVLNGSLIAETIEDIISLNLFNLQIRVLIDELVNVHVTSTDTNEYLLTLLDLNVNSLLSELVDTFRFSEEHDLHLFSFGVSIDVGGQCFINFVMLVGDIHSLSLLKESDQHH